LVAVTEPIDESEHQGKLLTGGILMVLVGVGKTTSRKQVWFFIRRW
jgi:hypothetical protein